MVTAQGLLARHWAEDAVGGAEDYTWCRPLATHLPESAPELLLTCRFLSFLAGEVEQQGMVYHTVKLSSCTLILHSERRHTEGQVMEEFLAVCMRVLSGMLGG